MKWMIPDTWKDFFNQQETLPYYQPLQQFVSSAYLEKRCYPPEREIFSAFAAVAPQQVKVVILGQDPYHGLGQANGLCFSVHDGIRFPPSLINIFKEIENDLGVPLPISGNLERWAAQGVLLLNATLTVEEGIAGSHQKRGWEIFTDAVIQYISDNCHGVVFLLWGNYAIQKGKKIDRSKHFVLTSGHPSPLSANRGYWFGNKHFSQVNKLLKQSDRQEILW